MLGERSLVERLGGREQQGLQDAHLLLPVGGGARHLDLGRKRQQQRAAAALTLVVAGLQRHRPIEIVRSHS
jgi:hypothetical protein